MNGDQDGDLHGDDVRRWLDTALSGEPPLSLDRAEIFRQGRRRLRHRKLLQAGGAVTGVVAVVLGAVLVGGLATEEATIPPAANPTGQATEQSDGPSPEVTTTLRPPSPPSSPRTTEQPRATDEAADRLTQAVVNPDVLPAGWRISPVQGTGGPTFELIHPSVYGLQADVYTADGSGWLWVLLEKGPGVGASCNVIEEPVLKCEVREEHGMEMTVAVQRFDSGEVRRVVRSVRPDGCYVTVTSSNLTAADRDKGMKPKSAWPPMSEPQMTKIAALPALYVR